MVLTLKIPLEQLIGKLLKGEVGIKVNFGKY